MWGDQPHSPLFLFTSYLLTLRFSLEVGPLIVARSPRERFSSPRVQAEFDSNGECWRHVAVINWEMRNKMRLV